jgi:uncharacterized membrane protein YbhN (UPF0104 family)
VIQVSDQLERRIRRPVDALRCVISCAWMLVLTLAAVAASATTNGVETDIVGASRRIPQALLTVIPPIALFALLILPVGLALAQLIRRQVRRLFEAVATGLLAGVVAEIVNNLLSREAASRLYYAIIMSRPGSSGASASVNALDPYLAALVAYATMIGLTGRRGWRNALGLAIGVYAVVQLAALHTTVLSILLALLAGRAIGLAIRYAAGSVSQRPGALTIAKALTASGLPVTAMRRVLQTAAGAAEAGSRQYAVATEDGGELDVVVFDRDQQAAGTFYRVYRWIRVPGRVSRYAPLSVDRTVERRALLTYATQDAGVPTPRLRVVVRVGPDAVVLAYEHCPGTTLAERSGCSNGELSQVWDTVTRLHARHVTHRGLTADRILVTPDDQIMLLDPGDGDVAASDLQKRLDLAQLIVELALLVGPEKSAELAVEKVGGAGLVSVLPLLQPVALVRSTRHTLRRRRTVLSTLRKQLLAAVPGGEVVPVQLERIRPRALVTIVASVAAAYLLAGELAQASLGKLLSQADWWWVAVGLGLSVVTYAGAALSVSGWVNERLGFARTLLVQVAGSFVTLVTPAAVGGAALNVRYLQRRKIAAPAAVASIAVSQVVAFVLHILLLLIMGAIAGTGTKSPINPPTWAYFVVAGLVALGGLVLAIPAGRHMVRARLSPTFGQVVPRLVEIAQHPTKLAEGLGGALLLSVAYIACLAACVAAFGDSVPIAKIGFVYLTGSAIGSIIPVPGGVGPVEVALTAGLTAAGVPGGVAVSAVLLFRLLTFWLPVPVGWLAYNYLERQHALLPGPLRVAGSRELRGLVVEGDLEPDGLALGGGAGAPPGGELLDEVEAAAALVGGAGGAQPGEAEVRVEDLDPDRLGATAQPQGELARAVDRAVVGAEGQAGGGGEGADVDAGGGGFSGRVEVEFEVEAAARRAGRHRGVQHGVGDHLGDQQQGQVGLVGVHVPAGERDRGQLAGLRDHDRLGRKGALERGQVLRGRAEHQDGHVVVDVPGHGGLGRHHQRLGGRRGGDEGVAQQGHRLGLAVVAVAVRPRPPVGEPVGVQHQGGAGRQGDGLLAVGRQAADAAAAHAEQHALVPDLERPHGAARGHQGRRVAGVGEGQLAGPGVVDEVDAGHGGRVAARADRGGGADPLVQLAHDVGG